MNKKILVFQFRTDKSLIHERSCILKTTGLNSSEVKFINILNKKCEIPQFSDINLYRAVVLGGSGQVNISDWSPQIKKLILRIKPFMRQVIKIDIPTLNICFGHQLVSFMFGGGVKADQNQAETGTHKILLNDQGKKSLLFKNIPASFYAVEGHKDSVTKLPQDAVLLASSDRCHVQAYRIKNNIYGLQFHPELDKQGMKYRISLFPSYAKGKDLDEFLKDYKQTSFAAKVLKNFSDICR